jgi:hypothetical protein
MVIPIFLVMLLGACDASNGPLDSRLGTFVAQTQTAGVWTLTPIQPSASPVPDQAMIVNTLNNVLQGADPLGETLDARFYILDIGFDLSGNPPATRTIRFHVECEWVTRSSCTAERAFVVLAHAFKDIKADVRKKLVKQIPETIQVVQVKAFDHMTQIGIVEVSWECLLQFANGEITGIQLAARTTRFHTP